MIRIYHFFNKIPKDAQKEIVDTWGNPPGRRKNGVPPAMLHEGKNMYNWCEIWKCSRMRSAEEEAVQVLYVTVQFVRFLHDPHCPPTHQYIATYKYFEKHF